MIFDIQAKQVLAIAMDHPDGFTVKIADMELITSGIAVAYAETQNSFGFGGAYKCYQHALYHDGYIGGWRNPNGLYQFDSIRIFKDLRKAVAWGRKQRQHAIFDIDNGWEIIL